ncbi:MAG: MFS transporter [Gemmatimonadota bacterium]|nr:MFS transporter [Gemmatimonadota bacterium]
MTTNEGHLSLGQILAYSLPAAPLIFMTFLVNLYLLKFTTDVLMIAPAVFGVAFATARVWDAISDPLAGYWSDRTRSRLGRRRPWLLAACLPMGIAFAAVWSPPQFDGPALEVWMGVAIFVYYTAQSAAYVPHLALGAEVTLDYHERSRLATGRGAFELLGMLLAAGAIGYLGAAQLPRVAGSQLSAGFALATVVLIALHVRFTRERDDFQGRGAASFRSAARDVLRNPHARILLFVFFIEMLSIGFLGVLFPFLAEHVGSGLNPGVAMGAVMGVAAVSVPLWLRLSRRFGKRVPWMIGIAAKGTGFGLMYFIGTEVDIVSFLPIALIGAGQACTAILPTSIKADVIDYDELETGDRKEGAYFAAWNLVIKLASAVSIGASAFLLQWAGYQPNAADQAPATLDALMALSSALPFVLHLLALALLFRFRLGPKEHARIRRALDTTGWVHKGDPK